MSIVKISKNNKSEKNHEWVKNLSFDELPKIKNVAFIRDEIVFVLDDERVVFIPLNWSKKLLKANNKQRTNYKSNGYHIFWDEIDEIIGVKNILFGKELFL